MELSKSAPRPKNPDNRLFAPTINDITRTIKTSVLKNPFMSPPKIIVEPATTIPIRETANATGPVNDFLNLVSQASYGSPPPLPSDAYALSLNKISIKNAKNISKSIFFKTVVFNNLSF